MSPILNRLFNKSVTIKRVMQIVNDSGDVSNSKLTVGTDIKMRINTNNTPNSEYGNDSSGKFATSTHIGFTNAGIDVNVGYFIHDGNNIYSVDAVDKEPGGEINHHYELGLTMVSPEKESSTEQSPIYIGAE